ncbi:hypothetical protein KTH71_04650 [Acinetobacter sp. WU_MDCI_Axc73]|nr:hypothetical protein [Acinetobacter sp. WU_MDCI_Axc73]
MKKRIVFSAFFLALSVFNFAYAANDQIKLKRGCLKDYPQAVGQTDQTLLGIYEQICDKKNADKKNDLLAQAAMRFHGLGQNLNALLLVNQLKSQNVQGNLLTDVAFLSSVAIANDSLKEMREKQMRYLSEDLTYPPAKQLVEQIRQSMPAPDTSELKGITDASLKASQRNTRATAIKRTSSKASMSKTSSSKARVTTTTPTKPAATTIKSNANPFESLK